MTGPTTRILVLTCIAGLLMLPISSRPATAQGLDWTRQFGLIDSGLIEDAAFANDGSSYVVGYTETALDGQLSAGGWDAFIRAYDASGGERWTRQFGSAGYDRAIAVAVDQTGDTYVVGHVADGNLPGQTFAGGNDVFIRAYDVNGSERWTHQFGTAADDYPTGVAVDAERNVYVVGHTILALPGQTNLGYTDAFIRVYDSSGAERWTRQFGTAGNDRALGVDVSSAGWIYIVGVTDGIFPDQPDAHASPEHWNTDAFIRVYDATGGELRTYQFGSEEHDAANAVAIAPGGRVFIAGSTSDAPADTGETRSDAFLRAEDAGGAELWTRQFGTEAYDTVTGLRVDADGYIRIEGTTDGTLPGQQGLPGENAFVRAYGVDGAELWTQQFDAAAPPRPTALQTTGTAEGVRLDWAPNLTGEETEDLAGYYVYRGPTVDGPFERLVPSPAPETTWVDANTAPDTLHYYRVTGVDMRGNESAATPPVAGMWVDAAARIEFERTWERTDRPVLEGFAGRTWMWGPQPFSSILVESYADAPNGLRQVQYFDKSRMEDNSYRAWGVWDVTNGLLALELITGHMQLGDNEFVWSGAAEINIAGDPGSGPTYTMLNRLLAGGAAEVGTPITWRLHSDGTIGYSDGLAELGAVAEIYIPETMHTIAGPFWDFMNSSGMVYDGRYVEDRLFLNPFYATGYPVTEAYWTRVELAGTPHDVLIQCFERRCLTYTPANPPGWQVEAGNVGLHYYQWRYGNLPTDISQDRQP